MIKNIFKQGVGLVGKWTFRIEDEITGKVRIQEAFNLMPTVGLNAIASQFADSTITKDIGDNLYIAVGSSSTAAALGNTQLGTEVARKAISDRNAAGAVASISVFFASTQATGTHREFGLFGDGKTTTASAAANSGILYSRVIDSVVVAASENLTVTFTLTFANA